MIYIYLVMKCYDIVITVACSLQCSRTFTTNPTLLLITVPWDVHTANFFIRLLTFWRNLQPSYQSTFFDIPGNCSLHCQPSEPQMSARQHCALDLHQSVHRDIIMEITNKIQLYRLIYHSKSTLHVSGDVFAHHQEHLTVFTVYASIHPSCCRPVSWMS